MLDLEMLEMCQWSDTLKAFPLTSLGVLAHYGQYCNQ